MIQVGLAIYFSALLTLGACAHQAQPPAESAQAIAVRTDAKRDVFLCPDGDIPKTGSANHKVALSWNASVSPSPSKVRYCLYRSEDQRVQKSGDGVPHDKSPCKACTRVNDTAIPGTSYTDTPVRNGAHYCYVAVAIQGNSTFSGFSNQVEADIPTDPTPGPPHISSGKLCEEKKPADAPRKIDKQLPR